MDRLLEVHICLHCWHLVKCYGSCVLFTSLYVLLHFMTGHILYMKDAKFDYNDLYVENVNK